MLCKRDGRLVNESTLLVPKNFLYKLGRTPRDLSPFKVQYALKSSRQKSDRILLSVRVPDDIILPGRPFQVHINGEAYYIVCLQMPPWTLTL